MKRPMFVDCIFSAFTSRRCAGALCVLAVLTASSAASAQDPRGIPDIGGALEVALFLPPIAMGTVTLVGGLVAEATHKGRQLWFVANVILGSINVTLAALALALALDEQAFKDEPGSHYSTLLGYAVSLASAAVADIVLAVILRLDMDDERWPRPIVLRDVNGGMAPGLGLYAAF